MTQERGSAGSSFESFREEEGFKEELPSFWSAA